MARRRDKTDALTADDGFLPIDEHGLTYPYAGREPTPGTLTEIAPGLCWTRMPLDGSLAHINLWILDDGDGVAVVDSGMNEPRTVEAWERLLSGPLAGKRVTRVFATHFHADHCGLAGWLCKRFDVRLWMSREEWLTVRAQTGHGEKAASAAFERRWRRVGWSDAVIEDMRSWPRVNFTRFVSPLAPEFVRLCDGDRITIGNHVWQVVIGRGHSPEHACLWNEAAGIIIAGDQILPKISSNVSVMTQEPEADPLTEWLDSIERLLELPEDTLVLPAHGEPFFGMHNRLRNLRHEHLDRLDALVTQLETPRRVIDCFETLFRRGPEAFVDFHRELAVGETLAHLRRLLNEGRISVVEREGVAWYSARRD